MNKLFSIALCIRTIYILITDRFMQMWILRWLPSDRNVRCTVLWYSKRMWWRWNAIIAAIGLFNYYLPHKSIKRSIHLSEGENVIRRHSNSPLSVVLIRSIDDGNEVPCSLRAYTRILYSASLSKLLSSMSLLVVLISYKSSRITHSCNISWCIVLNHTNNIHTVRPMKPKTYVFHFHNCFVQSHVVDFAILNDEINIDGFLWAVRWAMAILVVRRPFQCNRCSCNARGSQILHRSRYVLCAFFEALNYIATIGQTIDRWLWHEPPAQWLTLCRNASTNTTARMVTTAGRTFRERALNWWTWVININRSVQHYGGWLLFKQISKPSYPFAMSTHAQVTVDRTPWCRTNTMACIAVILMRPYSKLLCCRWALHTYHQRRSNKKWIAHVN